MYSAASSLIQNQVAGPLSCLLSQSSVGARAGTNSSVGRVPSHNVKFANNSKTQLAAVTSSYSYHSQVADPNVIAIINPHEYKIMSGQEQSKSVAVESSVMSKFMESFLGNSSCGRLLSLYSEKITSKLLADRKWQGSSQSPSVKGVLEHISEGLKPKSPWHVSYVSDHSFDQNKQLTSSAKPNSFFTSNNLLQNFSTVNTLHARGFKTIRSIEREASQNISVRDRLRNKVSTPATAPAMSDQAASDLSGNSKLKSMLGEEPTEATEKQVKVAFAEGYLAAEGGGKKKTTTRTMRYVKTFQQVLTVLVLLVLLASLMAGTVGGSLFRINVTNGNEVQPEEITVSFEDVRGAEEAKLELEEIVEFLKCPEKFTSLGAELPKGVLLVGPPGTGKTLLARAVAGEAGVPFFHAAGPEFDEILVGQGARRVRDLFRAAKSRAPCVIFIDEIDSVGAKRTNSVLHPYANQTINQLLAEMDGFHKNDGVIVLGATNRRDDLDKALLRPGRFDVEVQVPIPDLASRKEIFQYYLTKVKTGSDVEVDVLARGTTGFTGADIKNIVNQAALRAAADLVDSVSMKHFEAARDKVLMGPEKKSRIADEEVNRVTAYHEGGHTLVAHYTKHSHPLHKVTIIPRGPSLGHTAYIPAKEQYNVTRAQMLANLDSLMGGRAAEELIFGTEMITSGASSDLKQATAVATSMVKDFGMSDKVGLRTFDDHGGQVMGGGEGLSTSTKEAIDAEIKRILQESYDRARTILRTHAKEHKALAEALLKYETLDAEDIKAILDGKNVSKET